MTATRDYQTTNTGTSTATHLPLALIHPSSINPRQEFDPAYITELAASIRQVGLLQPLVVRRSDDGDGYDIVAGECRYRACREAGLASVPVVERHCTREEAEELALIENLRRRDLNAIEVAEGYRRLQARGLTQGQIAERVGSSQPAVANAIRLLKLPEEVQQFGRQGKLTAGHLAELCALAEYQPNLALSYAKSAAGEGWSVQRLRQACGGHRRPAAPKTAESQAAAAPAPAQWPKDPPAGNPPYTELKLYEVIRVGTSGLLYRVLGANDDGWECERVNHDGTRHGEQTVRWQHRQLYALGVDKVLLREPDATPQPAPTQTETIPAPAAEPAHTDTQETHTSAPAAPVVSKPTIAGINADALVAIVDRLAPGDVLPGLGVGAVIKNRFGNEFKVVDFPPRYNAPGVNVEVRPLTKGLNPGGAQWSLSMVADYTVIKPAQKPACSDAEKLRKRIDQHDAAARRKQEAQAGEITRLTDEVQTLKGHLRMAEDANRALRQRVDELASAARPAEQQLPTNGSADAPAANDGVRWFGAVPLNVAIWIDPEGRPILISQGIGKGDDPWGAYRRKPNGSLSHVTCIPDHIDPLTVDAALRRYAEAHKWIEVDRATIPGPPGVPNWEYRPDGVAADETGPVLPTVTAPDGQEVTLQHVRDEAWGEWYRSELAAMTDEQLAKEQLDYEVITGQRAPEGQKAPEQVSRPAAWWEDRLSRLVLIRAERKARKGAGNA